MGVLSRIKRLVKLTESVSHQAASSSRRLINWIANSVGVNSTVLSSALPLRDRCRDAYRNNAVATRAVNIFVANAIGTGIKPQSQHPDPEVRAKIHRAWRRWTDNSDPSGVNDFYGQQSLAVRTMLLSGEVMARLRPRRKSDMEVPLQVQMLEPDHCPLDLNQTLPNGGKICMGIEFSPIDRIINYHLYRNHPGELGMSLPADFQPIPISADRVIHMFEQERPGQVRGLPRLAPTLVRLYDLEQYNDAQLVRKKLASLIAGFITKSDFSVSVAGEGEADSEGIKTASWEPGQLLELQPGEDVKFSEPADTGDNDEKFERSVLRKVASVMGLTYEQLTGDLTGVNYSSIRAGMVEFRREMEAFQHQVIVYKFCRPIWKAWLEQAALAGVIDAIDYANNPELYLDVKWIPQGWQWVDPEKEIGSAIKAIRAGITTRAQVIGQTGFDAEEIEAEWTADRERAEAAGNIYETDPANDADRMQAVNAAKTAAANQASGSEPAPTKASRKPKKAEVA